MERITISLFRSLGYEVAGKEEEEEGDGEENRVR